MKRAVLRCNLLISAALLFVLLTTIAMVFYPGSRSLLHTSPHYSFTMNFFSDLGATRTTASHINVISSVLFMTALAGIGLGVSAFSFNSLVVWSRKHRFVLPSRISVPVAMVSGLGFIGIAVFPCNMSVALHTTCVLIAFSFLLGYIAILTTVQIGNGWLNFYIIANICYVIMLVIYMSLLAAGRNITTVGGMELQAVSQKVIVYTSTLNMAIQAVGIRRHLSSCASPAAPA